MPEYLTFEDYNFSPSPREIQRIYESGLKGIVRSAFNRAAMLGVEKTDFYEAFPRARDIGKGRLLTPYKAALAIEPAFGGMEAQTDSDCVSHEVANACSIDFYCDLFFGETKLPADTAAPRLAKEHIYGIRGHGGGGADPYRLGNYVSPQGAGGLLIRKKYTSDKGEVIDLSKYKSSIGANWGRSGTPAWINTLASENKAARVFECKSLAMARDALALGFGVGRGSWMSFNSTRNEDGSAAQTREGWSHAEAWVGFDATEWCCKKYATEIGQPCEQNSWGLWNGGPKRAEQPDGSYWLYPKDAQTMIDDGEVLIFCSVRGYNRELVYDRHSELSRLYAA